MGKWKPGLVPWSKGKGKGIAWVRAHVGYAGNDCLPWPYSTTGGYGQFGHDGKTHYAHVMMCELVNGPAPAGKTDAAHNCGNGHLGCVNPRHIEWKSRSDNQRDRRKHGTHLGSKGNRTNLTSAQIQEIRQLAGKETQSSIAKRMGVKRGCITYWQRTSHVPAIAGTSSSAIRRRGAQNDQRTSFSTR